MQRQEIPDFGHDTVEAVQRYFRYYPDQCCRCRASVGDAPASTTLRLFCEVTNPTRASVVGVERMPGSLTALFDRYLKQAAERISSWHPAPGGIMSKTCAPCSTRLGWLSGTRRIGASISRHSDAASEMTHAPGTRDLVRALEQDGVLLRVSGDTFARNHVAIVYDSLAGHIVAASLLTRHGQSGLESLLRDSGYYQRVRRATT